MDLERGTASTVPIAPLDDFAPPQLPAQVQLRLTSHLAPKGTVGPIPYVPWSIIKIYMYDCMCISII